MERPSRKRIKAEPGSSHETRNIVFFHPDLGIGGAERLVIDAAVGLQERGDKITIFTSHCDPNHCFDEARDGTLDVRVRGNWPFPATVFGRFKILCSILRQLHLLRAITYSGELSKLEPTAFFIDQLSAGIPFLRWFWEDTKIIFYCHFPDLLLVHGRSRWYKRIWRIGFDWLEGWGMRGADRVVVNSGFTKGVVEGIWKGLGGDRGLGVVYPCVDTDEQPHGTVEDAEDLWPGKRVLLSINRFERKKKVDLAIRAFAQMKPEDRSHVRLVIAGGYNTRVPENVAYHKELESLAGSLGLKSATAKNLVSAQAIPGEIEVLFLLSVPNQLKSSLLKSAKLLVYTPSDEHFGIVPLEAMLAGVPVLASNSGGPLETVIDGETGWLRSIEDVEQWTEVMQMVLYEIPTAKLNSMGQAARQHVRDNFSKAKMASRLDDEISAMLKAPRQQATEIGDAAVASVLFVVAVTSAAVVTNEGLKIKEPISYEELAIGSSIILLCILVVIVVIWKLMQNESAFR